MLGVFLRNEPRDSREPYQLGLRYGIDQPVGEVGLDPLVLVSPDDVRLRLDLSVLVFVHISFVHRARQRQKVLRAILSDERSEVACDELHRHVLLIGDAALEHSLEERGSAHHTASETEREARRPPLHLGDLPVSYTHLTLPT